MVTEIENAISIVLYDYWNREESIVAMLKFPPIYEYI